MQFDKLTNKFQQAISEAQSLALTHDNQFIEPVHLLLALLQQQSGTARPLLTQSGVNVAAGDSLGIRGHGRASIVNLSKRLKLSLSATSPNRVLPARPETGYGPKRWPSNSM